MPASASNYYYHASPCLAIQQQKVLSTPGLGSLKACLTCAFSRAVVFVDKGGNGETWTV